MPAAFMVLHAAAICGVHLAAAAAVQVDDLDEAAAAEALSSHANVSEAHVPRARTADAAKTSRECFITHLQGWERDPGRAPQEKHRPSPPRACHRLARGVLLKCKERARARPGGPAERPGRTRMPPCRGRSGPSGCRGAVGPVRGAGRRPSGCSIARAAAPYGPSGAPTVDSTPRAP